MSQAKQEKQSNVVTAPSIRILKIATCPSLSGKSELTYHIGCDSQGDILFRVNANSGSGYFNKEWITSARIGKVLGESSNITSFTLQPTYKGKSLNNGGFLMAVLKHEGLVLASGDENARTYQLGDPSRFMAEMKTLIDSGVNLDVDAKPAKSASVKKSASKKA
jgi:hypothetical protein